MRILMRWLINCGCLRTYRKSKNAKMLEFFWLKIDKLLFHNSVNCTKSLRQTLYSIIVKNYSFDFFDITEIWDIRSYSR